MSVHKTTYVNWQYHNAYQPSSVVVSNGITKLNGNSSFDASNVPFNIMKMAKINAATNAV